MQRKVKKYLCDIYQAGTAIQAFVQGHSLDDYRSNDMLRSAVERKFEIIGEALTLMLRLDPIIIDSISDARRIIGFRNRLIHGYEMIEDDVVWDIIFDDLPRLIREADELLGQSTK